MTDTIQTIPRHHRWENERRIPACESPDGCERTERECVNGGCGLIKITVHPPRGLPYRRWRHPVTGNEFDLGATPPCLALHEIEEVKFA